jgi:uncharacterized protein
VEIGVTMDEMQFAVDAAIDMRGADGHHSMVAHSGGPPLAMYLLPRRLSKEVYAGTTSLFFTVGNAVSAVPWLLLVRPTGNIWIFDGHLPARDSGRRLVAGDCTARWTSVQVFRICYRLLIVTALKLLWDGVSGFFA